VDAGGTGHHDIVAGIDRVEIAMAVVVGAWPRKGKESSATP
jgi:hypothetical protein